MLPPALESNKGMHRGVVNQHLYIRDTTVLYPQKTVLQGRIEWRSVIHPITQNNTILQGWPISHCLLVSEGLRTKSSKTITSRAERD